MDLSLDLCWSEVGLSSAGICTGLLVELHVQQLVDMEHQAQALKKHCAIFELRVYISEEDLVHCVK